MHTQVSTLSVTTIKRHFHNTICKKEEAKKKERNSKKQRHSTDSRVCIYHYRANKTDTVDVDMMCRLTPAPVSSLPSIIIVCYQITVCTVCK